jgi:hypothetical protein
MLAALGVRTRSGGGRGDRSASSSGGWVGAKRRFMFIWGAMSSLVPLLIFTATIGGSALAYYQHWIVSDAYAANQALQRLEADFASHPGSTPIAGVAEEHWAPRDEGVMKEIETILFRAPGRRVIVWAERIGEDVDGEDGRARARSEAERDCVRQPEGVE